MFEKEPAAVSENVQAGDKRKMTQSAVDQLTIKNALRFLREHNHLFKSNCVFGGTGGFYKKTAAAAGWSRRDYVKYRLLMLHPAFRDEPAWIFYQTDQLIKEQILNYNMNTVKVADLVNPLSKEDIERQEKDPYKRFGANMPANLPNSRPFMSSKCLDLKALAKLLGEPA
ncbi:hypothetical protein BV898_20101, partial [Hypsibius exemplaris]